MNILVLRGQPGQMEFLCCLADQIASVAYEVGHHQSTCLGQTWNVSLEEGWDNVLGTGLFTMVRY